MLFFVGIVEIRKSNATFTSLVILTYWHFEKPEPTCAISPMKKNGIVKVVTHEYIVPMLL